MVLVEGGEGCSYRLAGRPKILLAVVMKRLAHLLIAALVVLSGVRADAGTKPVPAGTFIFSDDSNYFGRMTVTPDGAFTGTFRSTDDYDEVGLRIFRGHLSFGGEAVAHLKTPYATRFVREFGSLEDLTIRHTPDGPTKYVATLVQTIYDRISPPRTCTYQLPGYRPLKSSATAGVFTIIFRVIPKSGYGLPPAGTGWAVMRLGPTGRFRCLGRLANNDVFSIGFSARADQKLDLFHFHSPGMLYQKNDGVFYGTMTIRDQAGVSDADGQMTWTTPYDGRDTDFSTDLSIIASRYVPSQDALSLLVGSAARNTDLKLGHAIFSDDYFPTLPNAQFRFGSPPIVLPESRSLMPSLSWTTFGDPFPGRFHGQVEAQGRFPFSGVFFSKQHTAEGFYKIRGLSGVVSLQVQE